MAAEEGAEPLGLEFGAEALDGAGLAIILVFYAVVAGLGIWAGWKNRNKGSDNRNGHVVGDQDINMTIGIFTMTATWVGGGYINGSAEAIFGSGLLWCQSPIGYSLSMIVGGLFFAKRIRSTGATTMIDPLQKVYGRFAGALLVIPAVMGELFWSASILAALGTTLAVIINTPVTATIIVSAIVAVVYTLFGGIYAVAYTDVAQLTFMMIGLFLAIPFMLTHDALPEENIGYAVLNETTNEVIGSNPVWIGHIPTYKVAKWIDSFMMLIFGGLPWQAYFQRVLSANSHQSASVLSYVAPVGCIVLVIPSILIGAGAKVADWSKSEIVNNIKRVIHATTALPTVSSTLATTVATTTILAENDVIANVTNTISTTLNATTVASVANVTDAILPSVAALVQNATTNFTEPEIRALLEANAASILPLSLKYLCPPGVAYIGLGAVAAAVMSSTDSSLLSAASLMTVNVVQELLEVFGVKTSLRTKGIILKVNTVILGTIATVIAITYTSVYKLFYFCADFVFVLLFPQLVAALFSPKKVNPIGSITAFVFGLTIRLLAGEEVLSIPVVMPWPYYDAENMVQYFPFKTVTMLLTLIMLYIASAIVHALGLENHMRNENYLEELNFDDDGNPKED